MAHTDRVQTTPQRVAMARRADATSSEQASSSKVATFTRYWTPFQKPVLEFETSSSSATPVMIHALEQHDSVTAMELLRRHAKVLPHTVWASLWSLVAEGPSSLPAEGLYQRLDTNVSIIPFQKLNDQRGVANRLSSFCIACKDKPSDPVGAGQPYSAVISEALEWYRSSKMPEALFLAWEALRSAFSEKLPIKHVLVQQLLGSSGPAHVQLCIPHLPRTLDGSDALAAHILDTCRLRPRYMHQRAVVVLCKMSDPRAALQLLDTHDTDIPFDVYAATITSLTWIARARIIPHTALFLAWRVMEDMQQVGMEADEQMYGEWIRALQVMQNGRIAPHPLCIPDAVIQALHDRAPSSMPPWTNYMSSLTQQILSRQDEHVLRWDHLDQTEALPFRSASTFAWLLSHACQHQGDLRWAVRLYHDWLATGRSLPESQLEPFLRACLSHGMPSMVRVVVRDACEIGAVPRSTVASHAARALFLEGYLEAGLALLADLLTDAPTTTPRDESLPPTLPPLAMYAIGLYEASGVGYGTKRGDRARLFDFFDEFRLVLAHTYAKGNVPANIVDFAYYGVIRLHLQALGHEASSWPSDLVDSAEKDACVASLCNTWVEWQDMAGPQYGSTLSATEVNSLILSIRAYIPNVPRPSAMTTDMKQ
ncbi:unnamed protein product [Malassezia sympodialis ATCC 42132]|uniref:uncharacterized protein n=1 Tax=Malassezia sympodialis (strain ATCC 42132) TaxID=1230383 RepID=UPI0002C2D1E1|nr:uncharacterized protein MSY001_0494 [Malassezia sympodialis ATCC 42132]CCU97788.1 unnamed protein product [Malassezia sympodialis ATCC 42132]|eukprot:XP_018739122.1 uncharacterized protein MSY001_0494 [Malassezia sympodialis ATCC 42132]